MKLFNHSQALNLTWISIFLKFDIKLSVHITVIIWKKGSSKCDYQMEEFNLKFSNQWSHRIYHDLDLNYMFQSFFRHLIKQPVYQFIIQNVLRLSRLNCGCYTSWYNGLLGIYHSFIVWKIPLTWSYLLLGIRLYWMGHIDETYCIDLSPLKNIHAWWIYIQGIHSYQL